MHVRALLIPLLALGLLAASFLPAAAQDAPPGPPAATPLTDPPAVPAGDGTGVRLRTELGDIVIGLFTESSPVAAENFFNLVRSGFYDGLTFHRLVPGFVIQGGDPAGDGSGGPGYTIQDEPVVGQYGRGIVAMARTPAPDSQGSQFFVVLDDEAEGALASANTYAIFGRVVEGMEVVDAIAAMPNSGGQENRAIEPVTITSATVEQVTLPPEPSPRPTPVRGDGELEAMIPAELGGQAVEISSLSSEEIAAGLAVDDPTRVELEAVLSAQDAELGDLSMAQGRVTVADAGGVLAAYRVRGADAAALAQPLLATVLGVPDLRLAPAEVAGKQLQAFEGPDGQRLHVHAGGEVVWVVLAEEPLLSEIVGKLP